MHATFCWCSYNTAGVYSWEVRVSDFPQTSLALQAMVRLRWERPPCLPLAGCVTFGKSRSPLWASVSWLLKLGSWIWFLSSLIDLKSNEWNQKCWFGARFWNTNFFSRAGKQDPRETGSPRMANPDSSHPEGGEVGSLPLLRCLEGCTQQPAPCPPAQCLLIKGSSSRKMGGSLLRKMNQQPQGEKEEDLWGHWTVLLIKEQRGGVISALLACPTRGGGGEDGVNQGWLKCPPCKDSQWNTLQRRSESKIAAPEDLPKPRAISSSSWSQSPDWKPAAAWFS